MDLKDLKSVKFTEVLLDYGVEPLVAIAEDEQGNKYLALAISDVLYDNPYLVAQMSSDMIHRIRSGMVDLLSALLTPAVPEWYVIDCSNLEEGMYFPLKLIAESPIHMPPSYLPSADLYVRV